jgi:hypothetical protein
MDKLANLINIPDNLLQIAGIPDAQLIVANVILTPSITITTIDAKLHAFKEDKLYSDKTLQTLIPRGCCFVFVNNKFVHALYGHPKFGNIDDYLPDDPENYSSLVFRRKENGECSHWSGFQYEGQTYEMFGSKNVHLVVRSDHFLEDIGCYIKERYQYATKMAHNIKSIVQNEEQHKNILDYFVSTGNTFCSESCFTDSQHLVKYDQTTALFFAVTGQRVLPSDPLVKVSPTEVDNLFKSFNLPIVAETVIVNRNDVELVKEACLHFESQENSEGAVVYRINNFGMPIFAYKHKNYDYIFRRALREKMRSKSLSNAIIKRMESLHIKHPRYEEMLNRGLRFNAWFRSLQEEQQKRFFEQWVSREEEYKLIDPDIIERLYQIHVEREKTLNTIHVIMFVAIPGSSKSTCAKALLFFLESLGIKAIHLEQDMFFDKGRSANVHYEKAIKEAMLIPDMQYIILTKSNHSQSVRNSTYNTLENAYKGAKIMKHVNITYVTITASGDMERTKEICLERIMNRGFAHASLYGMPRAKVDGILRDTFLAQYQPLTSDERANTVIELEIEDDRLTNVNNLISQLQFFDIIPSFEVTHEMLVSAFEKISHEDAELAVVSKAKKDKEVRLVNYDAIVYQNVPTAIKQIPGLEKEIKLNGLTLKTEFHTTIKYHGRKAENTIDAFIEDVECKTKITGYALSTKACAFMVELPDGYITEKLPHITVALSKSTNASYSATLLEEALATDTFISLDVPISVDGFTQRICL